jgi:hypothetical protein
MKEENSEFVKTGQIQKRKDNDKKPKDHNIR